MAGKGDKLRKGANMELFWKNYDEIFRKKPVEQTEKENIVEQSNEQPTQQQQQGCQ